MAADKVRAVARKLVVFHERFADEFGRRKRMQDCLWLIAEPRLIQDRLWLNLAERDPA